MSASKPPKSHPWRKDRVPGNAAPAATSRGTSWSKLDRLRNEVRRRIARTGQEALR